MNFIVKFWWTSTGLLTLVILLLGLVVDNLFSNTTLEIIGQRVSDALRAIDNEYRILHDRLNQAASGAASDEDILLLLGNASDEAEFEQDELIEQSVNLMRISRLDAVEITDAQGVVLARAHERGRFGEPSLNDLDNVLNRRQVRVELGEEQVAGRRVRMLKLSAPIVREGELLGAIVLGVEINQLAWNFHEASGADIFLVSRGELLVSTLEDEARARDMMKVISRLEKNTPHFKYRGELYAVGMTPLLSGQSAAAGHAYATISEGPFSQMRSELIIKLLQVGLIGLVGAIVVSVIIGHVWLHRPLKQLADGASRIAAGDLDVRISVDSSDEIGSLAKRINEMTARLRENQERLLTAERLGAWQDIARRMAHEIRNPLTPIQLSAENVLRVHNRLRESGEFQANNPLFEEILHDSIRTILAEVRKIRSLVDEFSRFARLPKPRPVELDLRMAVENAVRAYREPNPMIAFSITAPEEPQTVLADPGQISQVLNNLIKNSIEAMPRGGRIDIRLWTNTDLVPKSPGDGFRVIEVADSGSGMDEQTLARLFTPYFTTKADGHGSGLGLAICKRIVDEHGGIIDLKSRLNIGATVTVQLPFPGWHGVALEDTGANHPA
ncbi:MAG: Adaptive-response sensory-kinase SasA [Myxococcota bacterium]|nr:Adaptive-response sensory-kinase SasA [Myxococcota bacterium]